MDEEGAKYREVARLQYEEIERLRAQIREKDAELDVLVAWIAGDADAHAALCSVYADPRSSPANKIKTAASAIAFERSKPASVSVVVDFKSRVRDARMQTVELRKQEWTQLDAPILGGEGDALGPA